jgi:predicted permease
VLNSMILRVRAQRVGWVLVPCLLIVSPCWAEDALSDQRMDDLWLIATILAFVILWWLPFRAWALRVRRRWRAAHELPVAPSAS